MKTMKDVKIKAWGIKQGIWGGEPEYYWFSSKAVRDDYYSSHNYCDKLRCKLIEAEYVFDSIEELNAACCGFNGRMAKKIHLGYFQSRDEEIQARMNAYNDHLKGDKHD